MEKKKYIQSTQDQAIASWINYLNQERITRLLAALRLERCNLKDALCIIKETNSDISEQIVANNRGGDLGIHGFIAERAEVGIGNARAAIEGNPPVCEWINDNGPSDLLRGEQLIQQKFVNSGNNLSLYAIRMHLEKYPDYLKNGGKYQIPKDHYEKLQWLLNLSEDQANKMPTSTGEFSLQQWKRVHAFFDNTNISLADIEPSYLDYSKVQRNEYQNTLRSESRYLKAVNKERVQQAVENNSASVAELVKAVGGSAAVAGVTTFSFQVIQKCRSGKRLKDFSHEDWNQIVEETGLETAKGGTRAGLVYFFSNYLLDVQKIATLAELPDLSKLALNVTVMSPGYVANAMVSVAFGIAAQMKRYQSGEISKTELFEQIELLSIESGVSAISSLLGQVAIPIPVIGGMIGNCIGNILLNIATNYFSGEEQQLISEYIKEIEKLNQEQNEEYQQYLLLLDQDMKEYLLLINKAFCPDIRLAYSGSVEMAKFVGVPEDEILDTKEKIMAYFLD